MNYYAELNDSQLMELVKKRDKSALIELYRRYSELLFALAKKITGDENLASVIIERVFLITWKKIDFYFKGAPNPYVWFVALTRNSAVDSARRNRGSLSSTVEYTESYENEYIIPKMKEPMDPLELKLAEKLKPKFNDSLNKLTEAQKYVLHLAYYDGYTLDEIAEKLHIPVQTVRNKVKTAVYNLRDNLLTEEE